MRKQVRRRRAAESDFEQKLRAWAEITEVCLGLRGSTLLGVRRARSWRACVRAGLEEARRLADRDERRG